MSDALPAGSVSLESAEEAGTPVGVVTDPAVPVTETPVEDDLEPEGTVTTLKGEKLVPVGALVAERGKRKEAEKTVKATNEELARVKPKADRFDQVEGTIRQAMPLIEGMRNRPDLVAQLHQPPPARQEPQPLTREEAVQYAKDFDLFLPDGSPDVDRAQRIEKGNQARIDRAVAAKIAPITSQTASVQAESLKRQYAQMKTPEGTTVAPQFLDHIWANVPPEMAANPDVARVLFLAAAGLERTSGKAGAPRPGPVVPTESPGGKPPSTPSITSLDENIMKAAGISQKAYKDTAARYKPGQSNSLE